MNLIIILIQHLTKVNNHILRIAVTHQNVGLLAPILVPKS